MPITVEFKAREFFVFFMLVLVVFGWVMQCNCSKGGASAPVLSNNEASFNELKLIHVTDSMLNVQRERRWSELYDSMRAELAGKEYEKEIAEDKLKVSRNKATALADLVEQQQGTNDSICLELGRQVGLLNKELTFIQFLNQSQQEQYDQALRAADSLMAAKDSSLSKERRYSNGMKVLYSDLLNEAKRMTHQSAVYAGFVTQGDQVNPIKAFGLGGTLITKKSKMYGVDALMQHTGMLMVQARIGFKISFKK